LLPCDGERFERPAHPPLAVAASTTRARQGSVCAGTRGDRSVQSNEPLQHVVVVGGARGDLLRDVPVLRDLAVLDAKDVDYRVPALAWMNDDVNVDNDMIALREDAFDVVPRVGRMIPGPIEKRLQACGTRRGERTVLDVVGREELVHARRVEGPEHLCIDRAYEAAIRLLSRRVRHRQVQ